MVFGVIDSRRLLVRFQNLGDNWRALLPTTEP
jgi:hypothetical protein